MRLAIISGGSRGLGLSLCHSYLEHGFQVVEFSRSAPHPFSVRADLSAPETSAAVIAEHLSRFIGNSYEEIIIINNVGTVQPIGPVGSTELSRVVANLHTNLVTPIMFIGTAVSLFQAHRGRKTVAHITSGAASKGFPGLALYCAAKAGMENYIRSLALEQEVQPNPFAAISIDPGVMDTDMQAELRGPNERDFPDLSRFRTLKESGELNPPDLVADAVVKIIRQNTGSGLRYSVTASGGS